MPSSFTARNRFTKQATGENTNTWGAILNALFDQLDFALDGIVTISAAGTTTLTSANGSTDQARGRVLNCTAATAQAIVIPAVEKLYLVRAVSETTVGISGGTAATIPAGQIAWVFCDATTTRLVANYSFAGNRLRNVGEPVADTDAATKAYVIATAFATQAGDFPGLTGNKRKALTVNDAESAPEWDYAYLSPLVEKTLNYTAVNGDRISANTSGGAFTITLPASPETGDRVTICDGNSTASAQGFAANNLTVARNGSTINGVADDIIVRTKGATFSLAYTGTTWRVSLGG